MRYSLPIGTKRPQASDRFTPSSLSLSYSVNYSESELGVNLSLACGLFVPIGSEYRFRDHSVALGVLCCQIVLGHRVALFGRAPEPFSCFLRILFNSQAGCVERTHFELRPGIAIFGGFAKPNGRLREIFGNSFNPSREHIPNSVLRINLP